jgi:MazG family protein
VTDRPTRDPLSAIPEGPVPSSRNGARLLDLVRVMARLRGPGGCPWDHEQTHRTLARHLLEETHEVLDAIDADDPDRLRDELGDVLLQVVFHAQMAAEEGTFDVDDVAEATVEKLIRRHPHVFGEVHVSGADEVLVNWEQIKAEETGEQPVEDDIPSTLPALARASKVQRRAAGWGFDWRTTDGAMAKLREEVEELAAAGTPEESGRNWATCCSPRRLWPEGSEWTPRAPCAARRRSSPVGTNGSWPEPAEKAWTWPGWARTSSWLTTAGAEPEPSPG